MADKTAWTNWLKAAGVPADQIKVLIKQADKPAASSKERAQLVEARNRDTFRNFDKVLGKAREKIAAVEKEHPGFREALNSSALGDCEALIRALADHKP